MVSKACIFCLRSEAPSSIEHIIPRSIGNIHYILRDGIICQSCNHKFAKYEARVLAHPIFLTVRQKLGLASPELLSETHANFELYLGRFLHKMAFESLYKSKPSIWSQIDWTYLREDILVGKRYNYEISKLNRLPTYRDQIPGWFNRWILKMNKLELALVRESEQVNFYFGFGGLHYMTKLDVNLLQ